MCFLSRDISPGGEMGHILPLEFRTLAGGQRRETRIERAVIAGWTGRDAAAMERHIRELEAIGVKRPETTPIFYRIATARLTTEGTIEVLGPATSGEVEFVLLQTGGRLWVGVGSDHTDRELEKQGVGLSKQVCDKPVAAQFWAFDDVAAHWDRLILRSFAGATRARTLYQEGPVAAMRPPQELIALFTGGGKLSEGTLMFGGTLPAKGGVRPAPNFEFELEDPVLRRTIAHSYDVLSLPVSG
jgi:hypothetical protein